MHAHLLASIGDHPVAFVVILTGIAAFLGGIHFLGRWAAATHPDAPARATAVVMPVPAPAPGPEEIMASGAVGVPDEVLAAIAATVSLVYGNRARIARVEPAQTEAPKKVSVEALMLQWSIEGRRQIYSSHRFR